MTGDTTEFPQLALDDARHGYERVRVSPLLVGLERARIASIKQAIEPKGLKSVFVVWQRSHIAPDSSFLAGRELGRTSVFAKLLAPSPTPDIRSGIKQIAPFHVFAIRRTRPAVHWKAYADSLLLSYIADRSKPLTQSSERVELVEHFELRRERIGRIRDVDYERGLFLAVLTDPEANDDAEEVIGRFPLSLLDEGDRGRLAIGLGFTLATGRHALLTATGAKLKPSLQTRILLHRPRPMNPEREALAREQGRQTRARL